METPIYSGLIKHKEKGYSPFHTPGHKCSGFFPEGLLSLDFTELPDTDSLYEADGIIAETEKELAKLFECERSLISSGGCTLAIQTMLALACTKGNKIIFARNIHRSAVNTSALLGIEPVWLLPKSSNGCFTGRVSAADVENALQKNRDASAVYLTSPDYYGEIFDIEGISYVCRKYGALLIVDNAHGSHLAFLESNRHPIHLGADMSACSLHKTLPVLTGGAVLNIADKKLAKAAKQKMALFGSTSPSYPIMASIDICCSYMKNSGKKDYIQTEKRVERIKQLADENGLIRPEGECDPLRVCINTSCAGLSGSRQTEYFHSFGVEPEMCDGQNAVFLCTPFNTENDFLRLETAINGLKGKKTEVTESILRLPEAVMLPRDAVLGKTELTEVKKAEGRIAAESACPCPPGIPVVMPGELIDRTSVDELEKRGVHSILCVCK